MKNIICVRCCAVMGGKTSHVPSVPRVGGTSSLVPGEPNSRLSFFCTYLYISTCVPGPYQQPSMVVYSYNDLRIA